MRFVHHYATLWGAAIKKAVVALAILVVCFLLLPGGAATAAQVFPEPGGDASGTALERDLQHRLEQSRSLVGTIKQKIMKGEAVAPEVSRIRALAEDISLSHFLIKERFSVRAEAASKLGLAASERHSRMSGEYLAALEKFLRLVQGLDPDAPDFRTILERMETLLERVLHRKRTPIFGALPYRNLNYPSSAPDAGDSITPAYRGGDRTVSPGDLEGTPEAPVSEEIASFAQSLQWDPVRIYEWVKNNVETEWYRGCMKGAGETLMQKSGNDCDQAALLTALLRASGFPARYVKGTMEFFPGIEKVKNLTGIEDPWKIAAFFQKTGIPYEPVIAGGRISNFRIEHIWVEGYIPYSNYRGALMDEHGKTWLALDTSIKAVDYVYNDAADVYEVFDVAGIRDEYLGAARAVTPLEYLRSEVTGYLGQAAPGSIYNSVLSSRSLPAETMNILPASLQFREVNIIGEYAAIPDSLIHKVRFRAVDGAGGEVFDVTLNASGLSGRSIAISYEPETVEDQEIINSYGGLDNTPAYLVRLRPVLMVDGKRIVVGKEGSSMGAEYFLSMDIISPNGTYTISNTHITGNLTVIGVVSGTAVEQEAVPDMEKDAERLLHERSMDYLARWTRAEDELAALLHVAIARPVPAVVTLGGVIDVAYLLDTPHGFDWKGVYLDADFRAVEAVPFAAGQEQRVRNFMGLSALEGSIQENRVFEDGFGVESISTAKLLGIAHEDQVPVLTINSANAGTAASLPFSQDVKADIAGAVGHGLVVTIPEREISYEDWRGIGYIKEAPDNGEAGYMLSGMVAGGMTVWGLDRWPEYYRDRLTNPYAAPPNYDAGSAKNIHKITRTDLQTADVGEEIPLQVIVFDGDSTPVKGASVTFTVKAGGGHFSDNGTSMTVETDEKGIASVQLVLGLKTSDNSTSWWEQGYTYSQQVGENIIDAELEGTDTRITTPFTAFGFPDESTKRIRKVYGDNQTGVILSFVGFVSVAVEDANGNPFSNETVTFKTGAPVDESTCDNANRDGRPALLVRTDDNCMENAPVWGECGSDSIQVKTDRSGAATQVILGGVPEARYPITVTSGDLGASFTLRTYPFGNCDGGSEPSNMLFVQYLYPMDTHGNNINAGKAGTEIPVMARLFNLREGEKEVSEALSCSTGARTCTEIVGSRQYSIETELASASVAFSGREGIAQGGGIYNGAHTLDAVPALNTVNIDGAASVDVRRSQNTCSSCSIVSSSVTFESSASMEVYGVDMKVETPPVVIVDENGHAEQDYAISYAIEPQEYRAMSAEVLIYKDQEVVVSIPSERSDQGSATVGRGFWFDVNTPYYAEVVLNYGTGVEMKSDMAPLPVAQVRVRNATSEDEEIPEIKFSDGSRLEKKYHVEMRSLSGVSCDDLEGRISVRNQSGIANVPKSMDSVNYAPAKYPLVFSRNGNGCLVNLQDGSQGGIEQFIATNLHTEAIAGRGVDLPAEGIAPLYGGIGNYLEIILKLKDAEDADSVKLEMPIEPVGVIVLAIDGLRQDVLYPADLESVNDPHGNYHVDASTLPGLGQVLAGDPLDKSTQHYIMLPDVTAIFPSITLASWASVFTGGMSNTTGIMGNEFFARDVYAGTSPAIPGMEGLPNGMVTLSNGAFKNDDLSFLTEHLLPVHGKAGTVEDKLSMSSQNIALTSGETIYEWINKDGTINDRMSGMYRDTELCMEGGDCRSVVFFNHYARGADWWGTMDKYSWETIKRALQKKILGSRVSIAELFDETTTREVNGFLDEYMFDEVSQTSRRFPVMFTVYYGGLDHFAHDVGMDVSEGGYNGYKGFFIDKTDAEIKKFIDRLKELGEFDNKIFILTADHGHTDMPKSEDLPPIPDEDGKLYKADTSGELKLENFDKDENYYPELANNNLHIWEMAEVMKLISKRQTEKYKVAAPLEIADLFKGTYGATESIINANVIAALNGPMVHIYLRTSNDWGNKNIDKIELAKLAKYLKAVLSDGGMLLKKKEKENIKRMLSSVDKILIRDDGVYKIFKGVKTDSANNITGPDAEQLKDNSLDPELYVDALNRIRGFNNIDRSGDIVLIMKDNTNDPVNNRYSTGVPYKSWHGSLNRSDSYVPLIISYPGGNKKEVEPIINTACSQGKCEGNWQLADIVKEAIMQQFNEN